MCNQLESENRACDHLSTQGLCFSATECLFWFFPVHFLPGCLFLVDLQSEVPSRKTTILQWKAWSLKSMCWGDLVLLDHWFCDVFATQASIQKALPSQWTLQGIKQIQHIKRQIDVHNDAVHVIHHYTNKHHSHLHNYSTQTLSHILMLEWRYTHRQNKMGKVLIVNWFCVDWLSVDWFYGDWFCVDWLSGDWFFTDWFAGDWSFVNSFC